MSEDDVGQLAQAVATINDLRAQLAEANRGVGDAEQLRAELAAAQQEVQTARAAMLPLRARIAEMERLIAPPPPNSGLVQVAYADGRVKWAAPDGSKFVLPADALRHLEIIKWMATGLATEAQAQAYVDRGLLADPKA